MSNQEAVATIPKDAKVDHGVEILQALADLDALGDLMVNANTDELCDDTVPNLGYMVQRYSQEIKHLIGGAK